MQHLRKHTMHVRGTLYSRDLDIPEPMESEMRNKYIDGESRKNEVIRRLRRSQVLCVQRPVRIQRLTHPHLHVSACRPRHSKLLYSRHILPEVIDENSRLRLGHLHNGKRLIDTDRRKRLCLDLDLLRMDDLCRLP